MRGAGMRAGAVAFAAMTLLVASGTGSSDGNHAAFGGFFQWLVMVFVLGWPLTPIAGIAGMVAIVIWAIVSDATSHPDSLLKKPVDPNGRHPLD